MTRTPTPNLDRYAQTWQTRLAIIGFLGHGGWELCRRDQDGRPVPEQKPLRLLLDAYFGIDTEECEREQRASWKKAS